MGRTWLVWALLQACTWVTPGEIADKVGLLDSDADGLSDAVDCAPTDARQGAAVEIAYDGLDNDCTNGDTVDVDGDRFAALDRAVWEQLRDEVGGVGLWPDGLRDGRDCDDERADVFPGARETWYDGHPSDCLTGNDFDADLDGHALAGRADDYAAYLLAWPGASPLPADDCDDTRAEVRPGGADTPYDGIDGDCAFDNDFDADGDGYLPSGGGTDWPALFDVYRSRPGYTHLQALPGDCLDQAAAVDGAVIIEPPTCCAGSEDWFLPGGEIAPASVHPGACDLPQDGIDSDCAGDDDFDFDADGHGDMSRVAARDRYLVAWGIPAPGPADDCQDYNPTVHPDAREVLGNQLDDDCFVGGAADGDGVTPVRWSGLSWQESGPPSLAAHEDAALVALIADGWTSPTTSGAPGVHVIALTVPEVPVTWLDETDLDRCLGRRRQDPAPAAPTTWQVDGLPATWESDGLGRRVSATTDGDTLLTVAPTLSSTTSLNLTPWPWMPALAPAAPPTPPTEDAVLTASGTPGSTPYADTDLRIDPDGRRWWLGCRAGEMLVVTTPPGITFPPRPAAVTTASCGSPDCVLGGSCALAADEDGLVAINCDGPRCGRARLSAEGSLNPEIRWEPKAPWPAGLRHVRSRGNDELDRSVIAWGDPPGLTFVHASDSWEATSALEAWTITQADAIWLDGLLVVVFIADTVMGPELVLARIDADRQREAVWPWGLAAAGYRPTGVGIVNGGEWFAVAVTAEDAAGEHLGWAALDWR